MRRTSSAWLVAWCCACAGCGPGSPPGPASAPPPVSAPASVPPPLPAPPAASAKPAEAAPSPPAAERPSKLPFIEDDLPRAVALAKAENKAVFVDAWAPWCHTCLSMQSFVLGDSAFASFADRVVFAAVDTDKPSSAPFLERYAVGVWPTFFVLDPATGDVVGYWPGSASVRELSSFLDESVRLVEARRAKSGAAPEDVRALVEARAALARRQGAKAARAYARVVDKSAIGSPRRSEALVGWMHALRGAKSFAECAKVGRAHLSEVEGAAMPADFAATLLDCASRLPAGAEQRAARDEVVARLRQLTAAPPAGASVDDRADALAMLADALASTGEREGARKATEARLGLMEQAARTAGSPAIAATFDYGRASALVELGRTEEAVRMLEEREKQLPDNYEPSARLADVLARAGRFDEALAAVDRAIARAYGPRRLRYLKTRAEIQARLGDGAGQVATLREEVAGHEALPKGHQNAERLADARARLAEAERSLGARTRLAPK